MAPRANWKGFLRLSLVTCPIALFPATSESEKISFNQINKKTGHRIRYLKVDADTGEEVPNEDIIKGYQVDKDRYLEVTKGGTRVTNDVHATFKEENRKLVGAWSRTLGSFTNWHKGDGPWQLFADEPPELSSQLDQMVAMLKVSLTNILQLTNALTKTLSNAVEVTANFNEVLLDSKSLVRNARDITDNLKGPRGSLGEWLIPTNLNLQLQQALLSANTVLTNANLAVTNTDARLGVLVGSLNQSLENLANLTSNLNAQVQVNSNLVSSITHAIVHSDELVQGLKRHWLLRSAFKEKRTNQPPERARDRAKSPKEAGGR